MTDESDLATIAYFAGAADAKDEITRLRAELAALRAERARRPIESAPKINEETILLWCPPVMLVGHYFRGCWWAESGDSVSQALPTHWMPLPPAPEAEG